MYGSNTIKGDDKMINKEVTLLIPDYDPYNRKPYPGDIKPDFIHGAPGQEAS
jgi:hypothetical protein